ncbi:MAG: hypothetical protein J3Q66DRAFT_441490 [Benniella sp.]|nr:MAG: hypothetical protein J3Q66DRAFT_441490 [Benniella sp.]
MSAIPSQAFRARFSSETILIPTRHDNKSGQRIVLWKDILRYFEHAKCLMHGQEMVLFLTDDEFEDLTPLRIGHYPGVVLEVVATGDNQGDSSSIVVSGNTSNMVSERSVVPSSRGEVASVTRDVVSLRISEIDDNQALIVHSQGRLSERPIPGLPTTSASHHPPGAEDNVTQQEELHRLQQQMRQAHQQMEEILGRVQQTNEHIQTTQQQMKDDIDTTLQQTQQSLQQLGQRFDEAQEREEALQTLQQQLQQQIVEAQQKMQQLDQETQDARQQQKQQQQQPILEMEKTGQVQDHLSQKAFDQYLYAQHHVRSVLAKPPQDILFPRLFIILPESTVVADGQEGPSSLQFRLYFLCECGSHPIPRDYSKPHEVHLTNHPGYKLENQKEFIGKFGSYLLTMMYMVKYGTRMGGLVVPPLLGLNHATADNEDQGCIQFIKKNISRLVDDAMTFLQEVIGTIGGDTSTPQRLDTKDINELKSHLNSKERQHIHGDLNSVMIKIQGMEELHFTSVCSDHLRDCYIAALKQVERLFIMSGRTWTKVEVKIMAASETMIKLSNDALGKLLKIRSVQRWPHYTTIGLTKNSHLVSSPTDIFGILNGLGSLSLDFGGRIWVASNDASQGDIKNTTIGTTILLRDLTSHDLHFIQQYRPSALAIAKTPEKKEDENHLVRLLQQNPGILFLGIGCHMGRYSAVINLVKSTVEGARRSGSPLAVTFLQLIDSALLESARDEMLQSGGRPDLILFKLLSSGNSVNVMFDTGITAFDIQTQLKQSRFKSTDPAENDFLRQYGWTITTLVVPESFSDHHAKLLDESTGQTLSRIARLEITPTTLTTTGLDAMNRIINRSQSLTHLRLALKDLRQEQQLEKALDLLRLYKGRVSSVHLSDWCEQGCLAKLKRVLPSRTRFPRLEEFSVECTNWDRGPRDIARQWMVSMISTQTQHHASLKVLGVKIDLCPQDWVVVIKAIDLSTLEELRFDDCNFSQEQLKLLADRIADSRLPLPLNLLDLRGSKVPEANSPEMHLAEVYMSASPSQAFRVQSSSETILIPTRHDTNSDQRIVLWKDILRRFKNADYLMCGQEMVLFLTDDKFEDLIPLRIGYQPGVVLEVFVTDVDHQPVTGDNANQQEQLNQLQQQVQQMQRRIQEMENASLQQNPLSQTAFDQFVHAQYCVQFVLAKPPQEITFPRLFIILPEPTTVDAGQERPASLQFRLYFLCECGTYPVQGSYSKPHEVHLTKHPGYKLHNQKEFVDKFGSYLLIMLYMVKYGARMGGLVVPPLLGLNHAIEDVNDQGHLRFIKKNIRRLVDDAITYLQEAIGRMDGGTLTPESLDANDVAKLKSHLFVKDGECISGGLSRMEIRNTHYTSICSDHLPSCYESALQQLRHSIIAIGGEWKVVDVKIMATSEAMIKLSNGALGKILEVQSMKRWPSLTTIDLKLNGNHSVSSSTADIFGNNKGIESVSLHFGRLALSTRNLSENVMRGISLEIDDLSGLTSDDLRFIQRYRSLCLTIRQKPEKDDDDRLVSVIQVIQLNPSILYLVIRCDIGRYAAVINLVKSIREVVVQIRGQSNLCALQLHDHESKVESYLGFGLETFDMKSELKSYQFKSDDPGMCDFIRQFGWSIVKLDVPESFGDRPAKLLDECTEKRVSSITHLDITPTALTTAGLDAMDRIIKRSQDLTHLRLSLQNLRQGRQLKKALLLLERYKDRITGLHMSDWCEESCLTKLKRVLPNRFRFPQLVDFSVECTNWDQGPRENARQWIISMISASPQQSTSLEVLGVKINLLEQDWEAVIKAINLSTLLALNVDNSNFSEEQLKLLVDRVVDSSESSLPMRSLNFKGAKLRYFESKAQMFARIKQKMPNVQILE